MSASSLVYTVDEKGEINQLIQENAENVDLTDDNLPNGLWGFSGLTPWM